MTHRKGRRPEAYHRRQVSDTARGHTCYTAIRIPTYCSQRPRANTVSIRASQETAPSLAHTVADIKTGSSNSPVPTSLSLDRFHHFRARFSTLSAWLGVSVPPDRSKGHTGLRWESGERGWLLEGNGEEHPTQSHKSLSHNPICWYFWPR